MDKKLEKFRAKQTEKKKWVHLMLALCLIMFTVIRVVPLPQDMHAADFLHGFMSGALITLEMVMIVWLIWLNKMLQNEEALRQAYLKQCDERTEEIKEKSFYMGGRVSQVLLVVAAVVASYFSLTAAISFVLAFFLANLPAIIFKAYYSKKL